MQEFPQLTLVVNEALKTENNTNNQIARYNNNVKNLIKYIEFQENEIEKEKKKKDDSKIQIIGV